MTKARHKKVGQKLQKKQDQLFLFVPVADA
jgi:hypothetical protein